MTTLLWKTWLVAPVLGTALLTGSALAQDLPFSLDGEGTPENEAETLQTPATLPTPATEETLDPASLGQLRSIGQLSDVRPTDWAYQALRSLVERYNCIAGYPDSTFRGSRALARYEAAALVNACLDTVNDLITAATADLATQEDLAALQRLQEEFQTELAMLRGRVDSLEARTAELEANQFSTTTKLEGEALFVLNDAFGNDQDPTSNTVFGARLRLDLNTSFSGDDKLRARLEAENIKSVSEFNAGQLEYDGALTSVDGSGGSEVSFILDQLWYQFPVGDKAEVTVGVLGVGPHSFVPTTVWEGSFTNESFNSSAPVIYESDSDEPGLGGNYQINEHFNIAAGYTADNVGDDPSDGVFHSSYSAMAQLTGTAGKFTGAFTYFHDFNVNGDMWDRVGTNKAEDPFGSTAPTSANMVALTMAYQVFPQFMVQGLVGHSWMEDHTPGSNANAKSLTAGLGFIFPDALREGNEAGIAVGIPPYLYDHSTAGLADNETPVVVDMYYNWKISHSITVAPAVMLLFNGNGGTPDDSFETIAAIKTRFKF
ncbi:MAG: iron uptake porin [Prochlorothrix sp.]|nr:iron uptake porin [Prochlorothrix sp.]